MSKIRIAIDGNEANVTNRVGSNVYAFEIVSNLQKLTRNKDIEVAVLLANEPIPELPKETKKWHYKIITPKKFWTQWALPIHLFLHHQSYDVFFTPGHYAPRISAVPYVSSVMDLAFIHFPEQFKKSDLIQLSNWTKYSVAKAKKIITISDFSKQDIISSYGKPEQDIIVAYPAVDRVNPTIAPIHKKKFFDKLKIDKPYILYIGTLQPRKNIIGLIEAFEAVSRKLPIGRGGKIKNLQLVIAGKVGWLADDILERIEDSPLRKDIIITGFVSDFEKQILLANAKTLALVGFYEGFGIPALEALHHGLIPVVSKTSSLPEVVGDAGLLVDPSNSVDIAEKLEQVLTMTKRDESKYNKVRLRQISQFDWKESARKILKVLSQVAQKHVS